MVTECLHTPHKSNGNSLFRPRLQPESTGSGGPQTNAQYGEFGDSAACAAEINALGPDDGLIGNA